MYIKKEMVEKKRLENFESWDQGSDRLKSIIPNPMILTDDQIREEIKQEIREAWMFQSNSKEWRYELNRITGKKRKVRN